MKQKKEIIESLVSDLAPFKPSFPYYYYWAFFSMAVFSAMVFLLLKSDFIRVSFNGYFIEVLILAIVGFWSLFHAFRFADPMTHKVFKIEKILAMSLIAYGIGFYLYRLPYEVGYFEGMNWSRAKGELICSVKLISYSLVLGGVVYTLLRKLAPMKVHYISIFSSVGAVSFAALSMRILCASESSGHFLVYHYLPGFIGFGGGILLMKSILSSYVSKPLLR